MSRKRPPETDFFWGLADPLLTEYGAPFAPAGRVFREWVLVSERDTQRWEALLTEGKAFVGGRQPRGSTKTKGKPS